MRAVVVGSLEHAPVLDQVDADQQAAAGRKNLVQMAEQLGLSSLDAELNAGAGVQVTEIVESQSPLRPVYNPNHPMADEEGYIYYPNVNVVEEMADMISASRSFQINAEIMNTAKQMIQRTLTLGQ